MIKQVLLFFGFLFALNISASAAYDTNSKDSLRNEIVFSQDRLGYYDCSFKFSHKLTSNLWIKTGLIAIGGYNKTEPKEEGLKYTSSDRQMSFGFILGLDKHTNTISKGIDFVYGIHGRFFYNQDKLVSYNPTLPIDQQTILYHYYRAGIGFTIGFYYNFSERFAIGSELNPNIELFELNNNKHYLTRTRGIECNLFSNVSLISIKYRW